MTAAPLTTWLIEFADGIPPELIEAPCEADAIDAACARLPHATPISARPSKRLATPPASAEPSGVPGEFELEALRAHLFEQATYNASRRILRLALRVARRYRAPSTPQA